VGFVSSLLLCQGSALRLVSASAAPAAATATTVVLLLLVFHEVLSDTAEKRTANGSQEAVTSFRAEKVTTEATANSTKETTVTLGHRRSIWVVVGSVGIRRLSSELVVLGIGRNALLSTLTHLVLVGLILSVGVVATVLLLTLLTLLLLAVITGMTLRVASVVGTELVVLLTVLETALLRRTE